MRREGGGPRLCLSRGPFRGILRVVVRDGLRGGEFVEHRGDRVRRRGPGAGVQFLNGREYRYHCVGRPVYRGFLGAGSKGGYFNDFVKEAYACTRVR